MKQRMRQISVIMMIVALVFGLGSMSPTLAAFSDISTTCIDAVTLTNNTDRSYEVESIWFSTADATVQSVVISVVVGGVQYDQKTITVAGDTAWTANQIIIVPAAGALKIDSNQSGITNSVYIHRREATGSRTIVDGELADGEVDTAELAADAVTGAKIADDTIDSEHYGAGSVDNEHLADDAVGADELAADSVVKASLAAGDFGDFSVAADGTATVQGASGTTFAIGSAAANAGYFVFVGNTQLVFVATHTNGVALDPAVTNVVEADITTE